MVLGGFTWKRLKGTTWNMMQTDHLTTFPPQNTPVERLKQGFRTGQNSLWGWGGDYLQIRPSSRPVLFYRFIFCRRARWIQFSSSPVSLIVPAQVDAFPHPLQNKSPIRPEICLLPPTVWDTMGAHLNTTASRYSLGWIKHPQKKTPVDSLYLRPKSISLSVNTDSDVAKEKLHIWTI